MPRILIVDDDDKIRDVIREYAEYAGYEVTEACDGLEAVNICKVQDFDVMVMDIMMPRLDGYWSVREIRKTKKIPTLMLSARSEEYDKLFGFEVGIDDYVVKPFSPKELMMRLDVITRRSAGILTSAKEQSAEPAANSEVGAKNGAAEKESRTKYTFEGFEIDSAGRNVFVDGKKVDLTPKEFDLLLFLIRNKNVVVSRDRLLNEVWGFEYFGDDRTVDTHVKMLRGSIGEYRKFIVTSRGAGYKFEIL
jgi:two-component system response regulator ResD